MIPKMRCNERNEISVSLKACVIPAKKRRPAQSGGGFGPMIAESGPGPDALVVGRFGFTKSNQVRSSWRADRYRHCAEGLSPAGFGFCMVN